MKINNFLLTTVPFIPFMMSSMELNEQNIRDNSKTNHNFNERFVTEFEFSPNLRDLLTYSEWIRSFNEINSNKKPFTVFYDSYNWNRKYAQHEYTNKKGGFGLWSWVNYLNPKWYGANINIASGLEGWTYQNFNFQRTEFIGSKLAPNGLNHDDGSFAIHNSYIRYNILNNQHKQLYFYFGLDKQNENFPDLQFSTSGSNGLNISKYVFGKLNEKVDEYKERFSTNNKEIKSFFMDNLKVELQFYLTNGQFNGNNIDNIHVRLTNFKVKLSFNFHINYDLLNVDHYETLKSLNIIKNRFFSNFLTNNYLEINTDTGASNGLYTEKRSSSLKTNIEYLEEKIRKFKSSYNDVKFANDINLQYRTVRKSNIETINFSLRYRNKITNSENILNLTENTTIKYKETEIFRSQLMKDRLVIVPGKYLDITNYNSLELINDSRTRKANDKNITETYGGHWVYNTPVKINFKTLPQENEILYINDRKIDVINRDFFYDLNFNYKESTNAVYKIDLVKYDKSDINKENKNEIFRWTAIIEIENNNLDLKLRWFAWDPANNKNQRDLIEPFLKDSNNNFILNNDGSKKKNPFYDPLIDKETGTKKQLVWVDYSNNSNLLPYETIFLQDPIDSLGKIRNKNFEKIGFIAEAVVIEKGVNLKVNDSTSSNKRFKIDNQNNEFNLIDDNENNHNGTPIKISENENNYFSSSGIWLFTSKLPKGLTNYKIALIGNKKSNNNFTSIFVNSKISNFFDTLYGKHLSIYLKNKYKFNEETIKNINYEKIIKYWQEYVSSSINGYFQNTILENTIEINPLINEEGIKLQAKSINEKDFESNKNFFNENILDFENKDKTIWKIEQLKTNKNIIKISFDIKEEVSNSDFVINNKYFYIPVSWRTDYLQEIEHLNSADKTEIIPSIDKEYISKNFSLEQELNANSEWFNFENKDKVSYFIEKLDDKLIFNFEVIHHFQEQYFIKKENSSIVYKIKSNTNFKLVKKMFNNFSSNSINLGNETNSEKILEKIKNFLAENISNNFNYNEDYFIENETEKVEEIINLANRNKEDFIYLKIKSNHSDENKIITIFNFENKTRKIKEILDLSTIKMEDLILKSIDEIEIKNKIISYINTYFINNNISFPNELEIEYFDEKILSLIAHRNKFIFFKIKGKYDNIVNFSTLKVKIENIENQKLIDLSNYKIPELKTELGNYFELKNKIINYIKDYFNEFLFNYESDYFILDIENKEKIEKLVSKSGSNILNFEIIPNLNNKENKLVGKTRFYVINFLSKEKFKNIKETFNKEQKNNKSKKFNFLWLIPIFAFLTTSSTLIGIKFYKKFFKYRK
ncbi:Mbov_0399 family ICE element protein [Mycoplasma sp. 480]|uniref:Mbov_0399 family ICE element protein n=1 Tax=Mycoplasma sp. 480 TaxID=3440155 RepID=UPI003F5133DD